MNILYNMCRILLLEMHGYKGNVLFRFFKRDTKNAKIGFYIPRKILGELPYACNPSRQMWNRRIMMLRPVGPS